MPREPTPPVLSPTTSPDPHKIYPTETLIPPQLLDHHPPESIYAYNPTLARVGEQLLMAYRLDLGEYPNLRREIGICRLDDRLQVIPGSAQHFSASIAEGGTRHYDPRFFQLGDRLFIHYNNGMYTLPNELYMVEVDPATLQAKGPARPLLLKGPRQDVEKNWMFFAPPALSATDAEHALAIYWIQPHTLLQADLRGTGPIHCRILAKHAWDATAYATRFGPLYGGAAPVLAGDCFLAVFHSVRQLRPFTWLRRHWPRAAVDRQPRYIRGVLRRIYWQLDRRRYYAGIYAFDAHPPFHPRWIAPLPLLWPQAEPPRRKKPINRATEKVVYPVGALLEDEHTLLVSYGVHDEACAIRRIDLRSIQKERAG